MDPLNSASPRFAAAESKLPAGGWGDVLEGELIFRYFDRTETAGPGTTIFIPAGTPHTFDAAPATCYLIILTPRLSSLVSTLQSDRDPAHQHDIYRRHESELLE